MLCCMRMKSGVLVERDGMGRMFTAINFSTPSTVMAAFEEGEDLVAGFIVAFD
jgi:hypothetical protein